MATSEELPGPVKAFIVQRLARFHMPSQVVKAIKEEFGLEVSRQRVHFYDPTTRAGRALNEELKTLFFETREKAKQDLDPIPSYHKAVRLQRLDAMIMTAMERGNLPLAAQLLEQAAKESVRRFRGEQAAHASQHEGSKPDRCRWHGRRGIDVPQWRSSDNRKLDDAWVHRRRKSAPAVKRRERAPYPSQHADRPDARALLSDLFRQRRTRVRHWKSLPRGAAN